jgi:hypothetical protein
VEKKMIYQYAINSVPLRSGDIICTTDGKEDILPGEFWRLVGRLLPGDVDHIVIYVGPEGRCVEVGGRGVATFEIDAGIWNTDRIILERGLLVDTFYGVVYPLEGIGLSAYEQMRIREDVVGYCLAQVGKPYNLNFLDAEREDAFYCSQLAYKAYQRHGINLNTGLGIANLPGSNHIVYPQEIWDGFYHRRGE